MLVKGIRVTSVDCGVIPLIESNVIWLSLNWKNEYGKYVQLRSARNTGLCLPM